MAGTASKRKDLELILEERCDQRCAVVEREFGADVTEYISDYVDMNDPSTKILSSIDPFNIETIKVKSLYAIVNLMRVNKIKELNEFIAHVNGKLPKGGYFIGCVETNAERRRRILNKYPKVLAYPYYGSDFVFKRVFPKFKPTLKIYKLLQRSTNRVMSFTETCGRLVRCGFKIVDYQEIDNLTYFVARKVKAADCMENEKHGLLITLNRIGKDGKRFDVYKFRTMHPYAQYVQDYLYHTNDIQENGKFKEDFRITSWGRFMRKYWIDEQPMWINWFKREMKLVGVRPLSEQYFSLYPEEFQKRRIKYKPGLIPPFYVDRPKSFEEIVASEARYLDAYEKNPYLTDFKYFWLVFYNILIRRARSS